MDTLEIIMSGVPVPRDAVLYILGFLPHQTLLEVAVVSKAWHSAALDPLIWPTLPKHLYNPKNHLHGCTVEAIIKVLRKPCCRRLSHFHMPYVKDVTPDDMHSIADLLPLVTTLDMSSNVRGKVFTYAISAVIINRINPSELNIGDIVLPSHKDFLPESLNVLTTKKQIDKHIRCPYLHSVRAKNWLLHVNDGIRNLGEYPQLRKLDLWGFSTVINFKLKSTSLEELIVGSIADPYALVDCPNLVSLEVKQFSVNFNCGSLRELTSMEREAELPDMICRWTKEEWEEFEDAWTVSRPYVIFKELIRSSLGAEFTQELRKNNFFTVL
eukprot:CFRG7126T1